MRTLSRDTRHTTGRCLLWTPPPKIPAFGLCGSRYSARFGTHPAVTWAGAQPCFLDAGPGLVVDAAALDKATVEGPVEHFFGQFHRPPLEIQDVHCVVNHVAWMTPAERLSAGGRSE